MLYAYSIRLQSLQLYIYIYIFKQAPNLILQEANYFQILYMLWHMIHFITRDSPSNQFTLFEMFLRRCFPSLNSFKNFNKLVKYKIQQPQIFTVYNIYNKFLSPHFSLWSFFSFSFFFFFFLFEKIPYGVEITQRRKKNAKMQITPFKFG